MSRLLICTVDEVPSWGSRKIRIGSLEVALFKLKDGSLRAVENRCPHKGGVLSEGIVTGDAVICPMHAWRINLSTGEACEPDVGCVKKFPVHIADGKIFVEIELAA
jgi:nitrite reductase (NADH) small subunit